MNKDILTPIYITSNKQNITISNIQSSNRHASEIAGFHWRKIDYPYMHTHSHWELLLVLNGKVKHTINGKNHIAHKGYACLIRPTDHHKLVFLDKEKSEILNFCFCKSTAEKLFSIYQPIANFDKKEDKRPLSFMLNTPTFDTIISKTIATQFFPKDIYEQYTILIINRLISTYVELLLNKNEAYPDWLNNFLAHLRNPNTLKQNLPEIAKYSTYSYKRLAILFKQYTGKTLVEYIKELKITYAKEELLKSNKPVQEIAAELNYESVSSLNHNFKKATGLTPLEYRKANFVF